MDALSKVITNAENRQDFPIYVNLIGAEMLPVYFHDFTRIRITLSRNLGVHRLENPEKRCSKRMRTNLACVKIWFARITANTANQ